MNRGQAANREVALGRSPGLFLRFGQAVIQHQFQVTTRARDAAAQRSDRAFADFCRLSVGKISQSNEQQRRPAIWAQLRQCPFDVRKMEMSLLVWRDPIADGFVGQGVDPLLPAQVGKIGVAQYGEGPCTHACARHESGACGPGTDGSFLHEVVGLFPVPAKTSCKSAELG